MACTENMLVNWTRKYAKLDPVQRFRHEGTETFQPKKGRNYEIEFQSIIQTIISILELDTFQDKVLALKSVPYSQCYLQSFTQRGGTLKPETDAQGREISVKI